MNIEILPNEILLNIIKNINNTNDYCNLRISNKIFYNLMINLKKYKNFAIIKEKILIDHEEFRINYYYENTSILKKEENYKNNKKHGVYKTFYKNGNLEFLQEYKYDKLDNYQYYYHDNGVLACIGYYINDLKESKEEAFYKDGKREYIENYKNNKQVNEQIYYDKNGKIEEIIIINE